MSDLTSEERRLVGKILRDVAPLMESANADTLTGLAAKIEIGDMTDTLGAVQARVEKEIREILADQVRTVTAMADNLSGSLGHSLALLATIDERDGSSLPSLASAVEAGRAAIRAWQEAKPHIARGLAAMDD
jgi:hypothetical protein